MESGIVLLYLYGGSGTYSASYKCWVKLRIMKRCHSPSVLVPIELFPQFLIFIVF